MVCPACEKEYRPGLVRCEACGAALVTELPGLEPVLLCSTSSRVEIALIRSLLEGLQIPSDGTGSAGLLDYLPTRILVRQRDLRRAREVLASLADPTEVTPAGSPDGRGDELSPG